MESKSPTSVVQGEWTQGVWKQKQTKKNLLVLAVAVVTHSLKQWFTLFLLFQVTPETGGHVTHTLSLRPDQHLRPSGKRLLSDWWDWRGSQTPPSLPCPTPGPWRAEKRSDLFLLERNRPSFLRVKGMMGTGTMIKLLQKVVGDTETGFSQSTLDICRNQDICLRTFWLTLIIYKFRYVGVCCAVWYLL